MIALYWRAIRGGFLTVSLVPVLLGAAVVRHDLHTPLLPAFPFVLLGAFCIHIGSNLWNDYADDQNGADRANRHPSPFSGGSRVIQDGSITVAAVGRAAMIFFGAALFISLILVYYRGWGVLLFTLAGLACGLCYSSPPTWLNGRSLGEITVGIAFGPLLAEGTVLALTGRMSLSVFWASVPLGILVASILLLNGVPDLSSDLSVGKRTLAVRLGPVRALRLFRLMLGGTFLFMLVCAATGILPRLTGIVLILAPLGIWICLLTGKLAAGLVRHYQPAALWTIILHLCFGLLITTAFWW